MTDFIPFGTPPGSTGNPKSIIADEFSTNQLIKCETTATADVASKVMEDVEVITAPSATLTVDRTPYVLVTYAANGSSAASTPEIAYYLGMTGSNTADFQSYTKTPLTSASQATFDDDTQNGTLLYMKDKVITPMAYDTVDAAQGARQLKYKRFIFINPGGFINVDGETPLFPPAAGSLLEQTEYRVGTVTDTASTAAAFLSSDARNTTGQNGYVPTPFTTGGRAVGNAPTGDPGDRKKAWAAAIAHLKSQVSGAEAVAYIGYDVPYTDTTYATYKTTDSAINQNTANVVWERARAEGSFGKFRYAEALKLQEAGFDVTGYDTGGRIYFDANAPLDQQPGFAYIEKPDSRVWDSFVAGAGSRTQVEAVARDPSTGAQLTGADAGTYTTVRAWTIANQLVQINDEETNAQLTTASNNQRANFWELDPATTETHLIFRWSDWTAKTVAEYQKAVWTAFHRGWICGVSSAAVGLTNQHKAFIDYVAKVNMLDPSVDNSAAVDGEGTLLNPYTLGVEYYPLLDANKLSQRVHNFVEPTGSWTLASGSIWESSTTLWDVVGITEDGTGLVTNTAQTPRLRNNTSSSVGTIGEGFVSVDLHYTSDAQRQAFLDAHGEANIKFRVQWPDLGIDVETLTVADAEAVLGGLETWEPTPSGNGFIRLPIRHSSFATAPTNDAVNGLGNNIGWDADSKVIVDVIVG